MKAKTTIEIKTTKELKRIINKFIVNAWYFEYQYKRNYGEHLLTFSDEIDLVADLNKFMFELHQ